jgi:hypothetical protein
MSSTEVHATSGDAAAGNVDMHLEAQGGARRWEQISRFRASASITGAIWSLKGKPGLLGSVLLEGETRDQRLKMTPFRGPASTPPGSRTGRRSRPPRVCWWPSASIRRRRSPGSPGSRPRTTSRSPTSPARPTGTTSPPRSSWPVRTSSVRRPSPGMRTDRCGAACWSPTRT